MAKKYASSYFEKLNQALKEQGRAIPFLLIDLDKLDANIIHLKRSIKDNVQYRIVVKSLPSFELIDYVMKNSNTDNLMVFHQPFLTDLSSKLNDKADILIGKPMPIKTAQYYYKNIPDLSKGFDPYQQIQWLVDTEYRLEQYLKLANKLGQKIRINLELDVGLRRGGFQNSKQLSAALELLKKHKDKIEFSGFMGYDPHVVKLPPIIRSVKKSLSLSNHFYQQCIDLLKKEFPELNSPNLTFNGAGSPTLNLHKEANSPLNDVASGSCLVKPTTFDIPSLEEYEAASFIATPVLKKFKGTTLPGLEKFKGLFNFFNPKNRLSYFIYGGFWKADYCYPIGIKQNDLFGASTNQTMLNAPESTNLNVDDFVFLRPHQSEFVFLQFGNIVSYRGSEFKETWTLLKNF